MLWFFLPAFFSIQTFETDRTTVHDKLSLIIFLPCEGGRLFILDSCAQIGEWEIIGHLVTSLQAKRSRMGVRVKKSVIPDSAPESINVYLSNG